ncbi:MAG: GLPGLI family protein [Prevotellaceae bacterium]|jgi:GLPGLI family protein|nr:GLPGLI family protein [Prevotellaceae bacterium]
MKKIGLLIVTIFTAFTLHSQILDSANFECIYKLDYIMDLLKADKAELDEMRLLIGDNYTQYQSYTNYTVDSLQTANPGEYKPQVLGIQQGQQVSDIKQISVTQPRTMLRRSNNREIFFTDRKTNNIIVTSDFMPRETYKYEEKALPPEWEITVDTDTVLGYICQKAVTRYGGRDWSVWFAPEIAMGEGPWKLRGLPGLILKAEDKDKQYVFECTAFQRLNTKKPISIDTEKNYRTISKKDNYKQYKSFFEDPVGALNRRFEGTDVKIIIQKTSENVSLIKKYNPIELE